jgi:hypothetical protein
LNSGWTFEGGGTFSSDFAVSSAIAATEGLTPALTALDFSPETQDEKLAAEAGPAPMTARMAMRTALRIVLLRPAPRSGLGAKTIPSVSPIGLKFRVSGSFARADRIRGGIRLTFGKGKATINGAAAHLS